jgi:4-aminobutyrate aminotransferase
MNRSSINKTEQQEPRASQEGDLNRSSERERWNAEMLDEETREILQEDAKYFLHQSLSSPCLNVLTRAEGSTFVDRQGRRYYDFHGNNVHQVGFAHPRVLAAIQGALKELSFCTRRYTNVSAIRLAKKLTELAPGDLNRVLFAPGGAEAISMAIQLARFVTGRFKTISLWDAFHGCTLDAISVGGESFFRSGIGPLLPGAEHVPPPDPVGCPFRCGDRCNLACADYVEYVLAKEGDVSAVLGESMRSTGIVPPSDYWQRIRAACDRHGALLILDEIPNGLGRSGSMFTCQQYNVVPDILVIGKGLGGGVFPLAAILAREGLNVAGRRAIGHFTHEKNPVACAAALAAIQVIEEENLAERATQLGDVALQYFQILRDRYPLIREIRGLGLLLALVLVKPGSSGTPASSEAEKIMYAALRRGLNFKVSMGNILTLTPPLTIREDELREALSILASAFEEVVGA